MDPDAKMPDNAREFGPRDRLVRVRCPGLVGKLCPAPHRSLSMAPYQPADAAAKPLPRARTTGPDDGEGKRFRQSRRAPAVDAGDAPQARTVRCCSTTESEPPDGTHGNGLTTGVSQQEPYHEKGNDSGKSAANRRNPALLRSHRQGAGALALNAGQAAGRNRAARQVSLTSETGGPWPPNFPSRTRNGAIAQERSSRAAQGVPLIVEVQGSFGRVVAAKETVQGRNSRMSEFVADTLRPFRSLRQFHLWPGPPHLCAPVHRGPEAA